MTELNKSGVMELLHFHKGISPSYVVEYAFQNLQYFQDRFLCISKKKTDTKSDDKESIQMFLHKNSVILHSSL